VSANCLSEAVGATSPRRPSQSGGRDGIDHRHRRWPSQHSQPFEQHTDSTTGGVWHHQTDPPKPGWPLPWRKFRDGPRIPADQDGGQGLTYPRVAASIALAAAWMSKCRQMMARRIPHWREPPLRPSGVGQAALPSYRSTRRTQRSRGRGANRGIPWFFRLDGGLSAPICNLRQQRCSMLGLG